MCQARKRFVFVFLQVWSCKRIVKSKKYFTYQLVVFGVYGCHRTNDYAFEFVLEPFF